MMDSRPTYCLTNFGDFHFSPRWSSQQPLLSRLNNSNSSKVLRVRILAFRRHGALLGGNVVVRAFTRIAKG